MHIPNESVDIAIDLPGGYSSYHPNYSPPLHGDANSLISKAYRHEFPMAIYDPSKNHGVRQYIHDE